MKVIAPELELKGLSQDERATVSEIFADLGGAAERIKRAGTKWVALPDRTRAKVLEGVPPTWQTFLKRLQRVGEGTLHPMLYASVGKAATYLGKLPLPEQDRYLRELIPVAIRVGASRWDSRAVDVEAMSEDQRRQVFKEVDGTVFVRTLEEQQAYIADQERRKQRAEEAQSGDLKVVNRPGRWRVEKGRIYVDKIKLTEGITKADLKLMAKDMET